VTITSQPFAVLGFCLFFAVASRVEADSTSSPALQPVKAAQFSVWPQSKHRGQAMTVVNEQLVLECRAAGNILDCSSHSTLDVAYSFTTPTALTLEVADLPGINLEVNGAQVPLTKPLGSLVLNGQAEFPSDMTRARLVVHIPQALRVDASPRAGDLQLPTLVKRHPTMAQYPGPATAVSVPILSVAATLRWKTVTRTQARLRYPGQWELLPSVPECVAETPTQSGCTHALSDSERELVWEMATDGTKPALLRQEVALRPQRSYFSNGGLLVGLVWGGGGDCLGCSSAFRGRAAYEVGLSTWGLLGLAGEVAPRSRVTVIPTLNRVLWFPQFFHPFPAMAGGVGIPVRVSPNPMVGGRLEASLAWPVASLFSVGFGGTLDVFVTPSRLHPEAAAMLQFGL